MAGVDCTSSPASKVQASAGAAGKASVATPVSAASPRNCVQSAAAGSAPTTSRRTATLARVLPSRRIQLQEVSFGERPWIEGAGPLARGEARQLGQALALDAVRGEPAMEPGGVAQRDEPLRQSLSALAA